MSRTPVLVALLAAVVLVGAALQLTRPGYSVDEEFTVFAVRGIQAHGLPLLPSGLLYDRGVAYSYASWLAAAVTNSELPAFRALSMLCAVAIVLLAYALVSRISNPTAAALAALLTATSVPFWAAATSGRFYAPFFALYLSTLLALVTIGAGTSRLAPLGTVSTLGTLAVLAALSRWCHELAFTLAVIPLVCWAVDRENRRRWFVAAIGIVAGLVIGQAVLLALHSVSPSSGETMVRRFFLWQVLNLFERPGDRQFGLPLIVMVIAWVVAPKRAWTISVVALSLTTMILAFSIAQATNGAPLSVALVRAVVDEGSRYPLDMLRHIARTLPLLLTLTMAGLLARLGGLGRDWPAAERALHLLWIGWVLWFGVIESGITTNYLLLPVSFMLMAIAVDLHAIRRSNVSTFAKATVDKSPSYQAASIAIVAAVVALLGADQWRRDGSLTATLDAARPTIVAAGVEEIRTSLQPSDRVVCTDELGCLMLVGRIDRWLALDDYVRERFLVRKGDAPATGVYTGVPATFRPADLFTPFDSADVERSLAQGKAPEAGALPNRVIIVDIFKEYPIGNSRSWLPKAIEEDGVQVRPLLETPQIRVLEVSPPERLAFTPP